MDRSIRHVAVVVRDYDEAIAFYGRQLILETQVDLLWQRCPAAAFYPGAEANADPTNWWGPNPAAVVAMLRSVGFARVEVVSSLHGFPWRVGKALWQRWFRREPLHTGIHQDRMAFHAWR